MITSILLEYSTFYHGPTLFYFTLLYSTMALYFSLLHCTTLYNWSTTIYHAWLYLILLHSTMGLPQLDFTTFKHCMLYQTLLASTALYTLALPDCTSLCYTLPLHYLILLDSTTHYHGSTRIYFTLVDSTLSLSESTGLYYTLPWPTSFYFTVVQSTIAVSGSAWLYYIHTINSTRLYTTSDSTTFYLPYYTSLYYIYGSTKLNLTLLHSSIVLPDSTCLYCTLHLILLLSDKLYHCTTSLYTWLYCTLRLIYFTLLDSTALCHGSILHCSTPYHCSIWLYLTLLG